MNDKPKKYRKKPVIVEAMRWTGKNTTALLHWMCPDLSPDAVSFDGTIKTLEGELRASRGDWIIRGVKGEFYPIKDAIFRETYEAVEDDSAKS